MGNRTEVDKVLPGSSKLAQVYSKIHMADWDGDGLQEIVALEPQRVRVLKLK